jgi:hypothetical protein
MQVNIVCDDGYKVKFAVSPTTTANEVFQQICDLRHSTGYDNEHLQRPQTISIAYQVNHTNTHNMEFLAAEVPILSVVRSTHTATTSKGQSNYTPHFHLYGFKAMKKVTALSDMKEVAQQLTGLAHRLTHALDHVSKSEFEHAQQLLATAMTSTHHMTSLLEIPAASTISVVSVPSSSSSSSVVAVTEVSHVPPAVPLSLSIAAPSPERLALTLDPAQMTNKSVVDDASAITTKFIKQLHTLLHTALESPGVKLTQTTRGKLSKAKGE